MLKLFFFSELSMFFSLPFPDFKILFNRLPEIDFFSQCFSILKCSKAAFQTDNLSFFFFSFPQHFHAWKIFLIFPNWKLIFFFSCFTELKKKNLYPTFPVSIHFIRFPELEMLFHVFQCENIFHIFSELKILFLNFKL